MDSGLRLHQPCITARPYVALADPRDPLRRGARPLLAPARPFGAVVLVLLAVPLAPALSWADTRIRAQHGPPGSAAGAQPREAGPTGRSGKGPRSGPT